MLAGKPEEEEEEAPAAPNDSPGGPLLLPALIDAPRLPREVPGKSRRPWGPGRASPGPEAAPPAPLFPLLPDRCDPTVVTRLPFFPRLGYTFPNC